jgi:potassium efflux system protein
MRRFSPLQNASGRWLTPGRRCSILSAALAIVLGWLLPAFPAEPPPDGSGKAPAPAASTENQPPEKQPSPGDTTTHPEAPAAVTSAEIRGQIEAIAANESLSDEARSSLRETYEQALAAVKQAAADRAATESLQKAESSAPSRQEAAEQKLEQPATVPPLGVDASAEMAAIEAARREASGTLAALTDRLKELRATITERRQESKTLPQNVAELEQELAKRKQPVPPAGDGVDPAVVRAQQTLYEAALAAADAAVDLARQKLRTYEAEAAVLPLEEQLLEREIAAATARVEGITKLGSAKRKDVIESRRSEFEEAIAGVSESRRRKAAVTASLLDAWGDLASRSRQFASELVETRERATKLQSDLNETESLVNSDLETGGSLSRSVGFLLVRTRAMLPGDGQLAERAAAQSRSVDDTQEVLARIDARLDELEVAQDANGGGEAIDKLERTILQTMNRDAERYLVETLIPLGVQQQTLRRVVKEYRRLIDGHLLWVQSDRPLMLRNLKDTAAGVRALADPSRLRRLPADLMTAVVARPLAVVAGLASVVVLLVLHRWFVRQIVRLGGVVAASGTLRMSPTLMAMGVTILAAIPAWLALWLVSRLLSSMSAADSFGASFAAGLAAASWLLLPLEFLRQFLRPHGVAAAHFNWSPMVTGPLRLAAKRAVRYALPTLFLWRLLDFESSSGDEINAAARLVFIVLMVNVAAILWLLVRPASGFGKAIMAGWGGSASRIIWFWQILAVAAPLALAILMGLGYGYSAVQLAHSLQQSIWMLVFALVVHGLAVRWLLISRRRIALDQLKQRAAERAQAEASPAAPDLPPVHDDSVLDVSTINQQTRRLIDAALFVGILAGLFWIWAPVLPALEFLDRVTLWQQRAADGSVTGAVTLANLLATIPIVVLTFVVVNNAPGLLEAAVLRHLPIDNAARYAITTLVSYILVGLGFVLTAATLGLSWGSVQWLLAGLSVGLGFGLQEIVANFICGIILLFEQPIRPGDVVTLDGVTGVVSRIRIRATTVTTYERQEYIVPNKDLITGRVTNWTLSDNVNRAEVRVGVAYGTDTRKVCDMLRDICRTNSEVLNEPAPLITFEEFGDSALTIVLRMYLGSLDHRLDTINDVHTAIHEQFNAAGIEIAFPQLDVHVRNPPA